MGSAPVTLLVLAEQQRVPLPDEAADPNAMDTASVAGSIVPGPYHYHVTGGAARYVNEHFGYGPNMWYHVTAVKDFLLAQQHRLEAGQADAPDRADTGAAMGRYGSATSSMLQTPLASQRTTSGTSRGMEIDIPRTGDDVDHALLAVHEARRSDGTRRFIDTVLYVTIHA